MNSATMSTENTGLQLLYANTEHEVIEIIDADAEMRNSANWGLLAGRSGTFGTVAGQSTTGEKAATELITNMVDAVLTRHCLQAKIDPTSKEAPQSMYRAVEKFLQIVGGKIIDEENVQLKKYAYKNLVIGVTGQQKRVKPCYTFCDSGEGQAPQDFPNTFLSLGHGGGNKKAIPFVQGRFNQGSSGVLNYCGESGYKLIMSRRYDKKTPWGWTIVRKKYDPEMPEFEYFAPNGLVPTLPDEEVIPFKMQKGPQRGKGYKKIVFSTGTIVKLYEYRTSRSGSRVTATREMLNENMVETVLPFHLLNFCATPDPKGNDERKLGIDPRPFHGFKVWAEKEHKDDGVNIPSIPLSNPGLGDLMLEAIPLKDDAVKNAKLGGTRDRVFHHVNGQVQFKQSRGFLSQCGFDFLQDRVVIFVNASDLTKAARNAVWNSDRESINDTNLGEKYKDVIKSAIKEWEGLKKFNRQVRDENLQSAVTESSKKVLEELKKQDPNIVDLLSGKTPTVDVMDPHEPKLRDDLKYDPTYIKPDRRRNEFELPINQRTLWIPCVTDAQDDFFNRVQNRGYIQFSDDSVVDCFAYEPRLENGQLRLSMHPEKFKVQLGNCFKFKILLNSDSMPQPVVTDDTFVVTITKAKKPSPPTPPVPPVPPKAQVGFPDMVLLTQDGRKVDKQKTDPWTTLHDTCEGFDEKDGGYVRGKGEDAIHYINLDNASLKNYLKRQKHGVNKSALAKKYILSMQILLLGLDHALSLASPESGEYADEFRRRAAQGAAMVAMTLCDNLPKQFKRTETEDVDE